MVKKPILACGADLKGAFALAESDNAFLVDGFGDLGDLDNLIGYEKAIKRYRKEIGIKPEVIAYDLHPGYFSGRFAENLRLKTHDLRLCNIQHHEAHIASAIVDSNIKGGVIGVAFDGTGYGLDGNIWGGEFFVGDSKRFRRAAHFGYIAMPGGDMAIKEPWRMAVSYLYHNYGNNLPSIAKRWSKKEVAVLKAMIDKDINSPLTSSAGRLFDAIGSLVLAKDFVSKEAELPIELESLAIELCRDKYDFDVKSKDKEFIINCNKIIKGVVKDLAERVDISTISSKFHNTVAEIILKVSLKLQKKFKIDSIVLSGGVFQNKYLTARVVEILAANGLNVHKHSNISTNDSGIPIGQIAIANVRATCA